MQTPPRLQHVRHSWRLSRLGRCLCGRCLGGRCLDRPGLGAAGAKKKAARTLLSVCLFTRFIAPKSCESGCEKKKTPPQLGVLEGVHPASGQSLRNPWTSHHAPSRPPRAPATGHAPAGTLRASARTVFRSEKVRRMHVERGGLGERR